MLLFTLRKIVSRLLFPTSMIALSLVAGLLLLYIARRTRNRRDARHALHPDSRARAEFHAAGVPTIAAPAEYLAAGRAYSPWSLIPSAGALEKFERAVYEYQSTDSYSQIYPQSIFTNGSKFFYFTGNLQEQYSVDLCSALYDARRRCRLVRDSVSARNTWAEMHPSRPNIAINILVVDRIWPT